MLAGVCFAVPLRAQTIMKEKLKFPSGTATASMIGTLFRYEYALAMLLEGIFSAPVFLHGRVLPFKKCAYNFAQ